jgi:phosphate transport system permease protein
VAPARPRESRADRLFYLSLLPFAATGFAVILAVFAVLAYESLPALRHYGPEILVSERWAPSESLERASYGLAPAIAGTLATAAIATVIAVPAAVATAVFVEEVLRPGLGTRSRAS